MNSSLKLLLVVPTLFLLACGGGGPTGPIGTPDAGSAPADSGQHSDAGGITEDGGPGDAGGTPEDAGSGDAGSTTGDGGTEDAGTQTPPPAPTLIGTQPDATGSEPQPLALGTAEPGVTVELYDSFTCSGVAMATGTASAEGRFSIRFPATRNGSTYVTAKARRGALVSGCSTTWKQYTHDDRVPLVVEVTPASNATNVALTVAPVARFSESVVEASVKLEVSCGGQPVAGTVAVSGNRATFTPNASLPEQATCTVTIREAADLAGNGLAVAYSWSFTTLRVGTPSSPTITGTTPTSPGNSTTPSVVGRATAGLTVELFTNAVCTAGTAVASGTVNASGNFSIPVTVTANASTTFRAQAVDSGGRRSTCSNTTATYLHDGVAPSLLNVTPVAGATNVPRGSVVRATLSEAAKGVASDLSVRCGDLVPTGTTTFSGAQVTFNPEPSLPYEVTCTATLAATVTDLAGNRLAAAHSWSFTVEESPPPNTPSLTGMTPASPGRTTTPSVRGGASPGLNVELFTTADCSGEVVGSGTSNTSGAFVIPVTVAENSTTTFRAQAINASGRRSTCSTQSTTYVHDIVAPTVVSTRPAADAVDVETNTAVSVTFSEQMRNPSGALSVQCNGVAVNGSTAVSGTVMTFTPTQPLPFDVSCTVRVATSVTDFAGNPLAAVYSWSFTMRESPPPGPPTLTRTDPTSPGNSTTPTVVGTATAGHLIELYTGDDCSGTPVASGTVDAQGRFAIPVAVNTNATTLIRATARARPNRPSSTCTQALGYRHDGVQPTVVSVSPANDATDVQPSALLFVDFSELIVAQTGDVEVRCSDVVIPGLVGVVQRRLTFYPAVQLWMEATCTATVRTGVKDEAGNALADAWSWAFMTRPYGWSPGPVVATVSGGPTSVEVSLSNAGAGTLVWRGDQGPYATTRHELNLDQGASTGLVLNTTDSFMPAVATSPNGHTVIAWLESSRSVPSRIVATVFIPGTGWSTPEVISTSGLGPLDPQVAIDNSGQALVVFRQHPNTSVFPYSLYARRFQPGVGWMALNEIDGVVDDIADVLDPTVTRDGRGGFLVVWNGEFYQQGTGYREYLCFNWLRAGTTPGTVTWTGARYLLNESSPRHLRAGCDAQGNCTVVYQGRSSDARAVRYDAATQQWSNPFILGPTSGGSEGVGVAVNATGQAVAAFSHYSSTRSDYEILVRHYELGVGWSEPQSVGPLTEFRGTGFFDVGIDAQGNAVVLSRQYTFNPTTRLFASRFRVGVGWMPAEEVAGDVDWRSATSSERAHGPRMAMNANGRVLIGYWKGNTVYSRWLE